MNYGMTFSQALAACESDLAYFDDASPAMEVLTMTEQAKKASTKDNTDNTLRTPEQITQELEEQLDNITEKMNATIKRIHGQTLRLLDNTWKSNETFIQEYNSMANQYQFVDELQIINWSYGHKAENYLFSKLAKLRAIINNNIGYLNHWEKVPTNALLPKSGKILDKELIGEMGAPSSINTPDEFMGHLRNQFRGRKSEKAYRGDMAKAFIQEIRSFAKTKSTYNQDINAADRAVKSIQNAAKNQLRNTKYEENQKRAFMKLVKNLYRMITVYVNMIYFMYRLDVEYILNRRAIVNRLFKKTESESEKKARQQRRKQEERKAGNSGT